MTSPSAGAAAMRRSETALHFDGPFGSVWLAGDAIDAVVDKLALMLPDWHATKLSDAPDSPHVVVDRCGAGFAVTLTAVGERVEAADDWEAADRALGGLLTSAALMAPSQALVLHAAAIELGGGAVLLVGESGAGKSTIAAELSLRCHRVFGDDSVLLERGASGETIVRCLGMAMKARLPLPDTASEGLRNHLTARRLEEWEDGVLYRAAPATEPLPGEASPVAAFVFLNWSEGAPPRLEHVPAPEAILLLLRQCGRANRTASDLLAEMTALASRIPAHRLTFGDSRVASERLAGQDWTKPADSIEAVQSLAR